MCTDVMVSDGAMVCTDVMVSDGVMACAVMVSDGVMACAVMVSDGVSCVARCCSRNVHYKFGHNPNTHVLVLLLPSLSAVSRVQPGRGGGRKVEKWCKGKYGMIGGSRDR